MVTPHAREPAPPAPDSERQAPARATQSPSSGVHRAVAVPPPILASRELLDEVAPLQPWRRLSRAAYSAAGAALVALGVASRAGLGPAEAGQSASSLAFSAGGALAAAAVLPFGYRERAGVAGACAVVVMALGLDGLGPLAGLALDGGVVRDVARLTALCVLPAALLFRAQFGEYRGARVVLAGGITASLPFVALGALLAADPGAAGVPRIAAAASVIAVVGACLALLGSGAARAGTAFAALLLTILPLEIALRELTPLADADAGRLAYPTTAAAMAACGAVAAIALFQLLAGALAQRARCDLDAGRRAG